MDSEGVALSRRGIFSGAVDFAETGKGNLAVTVTIKEPDADARRDASEIRPAPRDDKFWGFGEQYNYIDSARTGDSDLGAGAGRRPQKRNSSYPPTGSFTDTYFPDAAYFMDPAKGKASSSRILNTSVFNLCNKQSDTRGDVEVWNNAIGDVHRDAGT